MEEVLNGTHGYSYSYSSRIGSSSSSWYAMQMITADDHVTTAGPPPPLWGYPHLLAPPLQVEQLVSGSLLSDAASMNCTSMNTAGCGGEKEDQVVSSTIRAKIASHPLYPQLVLAYIDCQKVGAPPVIAALLDEIWIETSGASALVETCFGADPELDNFMETYHKILMKYRADLSRPFVEASSFLTDIEAQFNSLCNCSPLLLLSDEAGGSSDECLSGGDGEVTDPYRPSELDGELKDRLLSKYSDYISTLKHEFTKAKKKGKLPKEAKYILLDWWNTHYKWPYPTESDKVALVDATGLDRKQINNWFINQRKRHWKPTTENTQVSVFNTLYTSPFS